MPFSNILLGTWKRGLYDFLFAYPGEVSLTNAMVDTLVEMGFAANAATQALLLCDWEQGCIMWASIPYIYILYDYMCIYIKYIYKNKSKPCSVMFDI